MPGHTFLYSPPVNMIRELIQRGELGDIYFISMSRVNLGLHQSDVSVAWDLGPHDFSILRYWLDETPSHLSAMSRSCVFPTTPDIAFINLEYRQGAIAHVELSWLAPSKLRRTTVVGSEEDGRLRRHEQRARAGLRLGGDAPRPAVLRRVPAHVPDRRRSCRRRVDAAEPLQLEMADFCAAVRTGSKPRSSARVGVEVVRMIEAVDASLDSSGARVALADTALPAH